MPRAALGAMELRPDPGDSTSMTTKPTSARPRSPRLIALTFVGAFAASVATVIYTGLLVKAPRTEISAALPNVRMAVHEVRTVNLVFMANAPIADASLTINLPAGFDLIGYEGQRQVHWNTRLESGNNILPITLMARVPSTGQIVARLRHGEQEKVFRVHLDAQAR
jgi:hypothetical protein